MNIQLSATAIGHLIGPYLPGPLLARGRELDGHVVAVKQKSHG